MNAEIRRLYLLGDKTLSGIERSLNSLLLKDSIPWRVVDAGFDSWQTEIMNPQSKVRTDTDAAIGFLLSPRILERPESGMPEISALLAVLCGLAPSRTVLCSNLFPDPARVLPLVENSKLLTAAARINEQLQVFAANHAWFHVVDHMSLALREGLRSLTDPRFEASAQMYFSPSGARVVAKSWSRVLRAVSRPAAKVLVVDLDNTLWRGVLGEDGPEGLEMGSNATGWAFRTLQQSMLKLKENGVLLAVSSKNNPQEAIKVLAEHPDCVLRPNDFCALEIGWQPKSEAIRAIAKRLRLGLDSFVFLDDSAFERAEVKQAIPEVTVVDFPEDPIELTSRLAECDAFDSMRVTVEDVRRSEDYAAEARRGALRESAPSAEAFFRSLNITLKLFRAEQAHVSRLHQLILKTNQFNLTADRLASDKFAALLQRKDVWVIGMRVADSFGDSGITGLAIVEGVGSERFRVPLFLLSCRVIGRTVENGFVAWIVERALRQGANTVEFSYAASGRNQVALEFLQRSGLRDAQGGLLWSTDVPPSPPGLAAHFVAIDDQGFG